VSYTSSNINKRLQRVRHYHTLTASDSWGLEAISIAQPASTRGDSRPVTPILRPNSAADHLMRHIPALTSRHTHVCPVLPKDTLPKASASFDGGMVDVPDGGSELVGGRDTSSEA
jgi:hypothetical protein